MASTACTCKAPWIVLTRFGANITNILCMFYVPFSIAMIAQSEEKIIIIIHACIIDFVLITRILYVVLLSF